MEGPCAPTTAGRGVRRRATAAAAAAIALGTLALLDATAAFVSPASSVPARAPAYGHAAAAGSRRRPVPGAGAGTAAGLVVLGARAKAGGGSSSEGDSAKSGDKKGSGSKKPAASASATKGKGGGKGAAAATKQQLTPVPEGEALYDEALLEGGLAHGQRYEGDKKFNLMGQSEDVIAPWSVDGFEIDIPDWRPQPAAEYKIDVPQKVLDSLGKIENMFGASLRLVSTKDGIWRFFYFGNIRNLIGAEAWTKLLLQEDLKVPNVKEVRFESNYVRDWPDDHN